MFTPNDLVDLLMEHLAPLLASGAPSSEKGGAPKSQSPGLDGPKGKLFLTEFDIKKRLTGGGGPLTIPKDAIISPLATDWLTLRGIKIIRE